MKNILTIFSLTVLIACGNENKNHTEMENSPNKGEMTSKKLPLVSLFEIKSQKFNHYVELQGNVETNQNIVVYPELSGKLLDLKATMGDQVNKGQTVAIIDDGGIQKQLAQAEEKAKFSKITYEKRKRLWDQKIGSEIEFLAAETQYLADQELVKQINEQLGKTVVQAPFSGIIDEIIADKGQLVIPGQTPLFRIVNLTSMYVKVDVPEKYLRTITKGKKVKVNLAVLDTVIETRVQKVSNYINPENRTYRIEINVPNREGMIKPNLTAKLMINDYQNENAVLIPQSIISENSSGQQYIYRAILQSGKNTAITQKTFIETGVKQGDNIEVIKGLNVADIVIHEGARTVKDQQEVEIIK